VPEDLFQVAQHRAPPHQEAFFMPQGITEVQGAKEQEKVVADRNLTPKIQ
jgi:hypothetical protein